MGKRKRGNAFEVVPATHDGGGDDQNDMQTEQPRKPAHDDDDDDDQQLDQHDDSNEQYDPSSAHDQPLLDDTDSSVPAYYLNLQDFTSQLTHPDTATVESALARFIAQIKGEYTEHKANPSPLPSEPPSPLLAAYLAASPQAHELFALLGRTSSSYTLTAKLLDSLHLILSPRYHAPSATLLAVLSGVGRRFLRSHVRLLYRLMGLQDTRLPAVALRLLTTLCSLSHDLLRDTVHALDLHNKAFLSIASRVQAAQGGKAAEGKAAVGENKEKRLQQLQRLRTAYLSLFLLLIRSTDPSVLTTLLHCAPYLASVVKGLKADPADTVQSVLTAFVAVLEVRGVNDELRYTALFSSHTLDSLTRLYVEDEREGGGRLAGVLHDFFMGVLGVVRSGHAWSVEHREFSRWKYHKQLLTRLLSALHPTASHHQQQLSLAILASFPSLLPSYLTHLSVAFEPRLSTRYVANVALLCRLLAVRLSGEHLLFLAGECQSAGQFVQLVMSHLLPNSLTKLLLSQSIQHSNPLVQLTALTLVTTLLTRYHHITTLLQPTLATHLAYHADLAAELRKRLPDIQVVFGLRAKVFPSAESGNGEGADGRVELYGRVLDVLGLYQRLVVVDDGGSVGGVGKVDMWKLLLTPAPFTWRTTQQLLTLLASSNNSPRLFHLPQRLVKEESKQVEEADDQQQHAKPTSYFGHLLTILLHCRTHSASSPTAAAIVHQQAMELVATVLSRTGVYRPASASHRLELVAFLSLLTPAVLPFVEHVVAVAQGKGAIGGGAGGVGFESFPLLRAALYGRAWVGSGREYERASGYVSAVLSRLLTAVNEQRAEVAEAVVQLARPDEAVDESAMADDASEQKVTRAARTGVVQQLREDPRFHAVLSHAASLLPGKQALPKLASAAKQHPFSRLLRLSGEQWLTQLPTLVRDALTSGSSRHSLLLHLALNDERPLLTFEWVQQQLTADEQKEDSAAVQAFIASLPPSVLFRPTLLPDCGPAVSLLCERWARDGHSAAERLVLLTELASVLLDALAAVAAGSISGSSIVVSLAAITSLVHSLVLSGDATSADGIVSRLSAVLSVEREGRRLVDYFLLSSDELPAHLSSMLTLALTSLLHSALSTSTSSDLHSLGEPFLIRLIDSCLTLVQSSLSSTVPLPLLVLASLSSHLTSVQLTRLSSALLCSPSAGAWLRVLSRQTELARLLLSHSPARAFAVIAEQLAVSGDEGSDDEQALDDLTLDLLQPTHSETASASLRASLVPEQLFTAALSRPSAARLRLATTLLRSTASVVYVQPFATHVVKKLSTSSSDTELLSFLPSFAAYVRATAALPASLLPDSHSAVVALLVAMLQSCYLPAIRSASVEQPMVEQMDELVKSMVDAQALSIDDRHAMLTLLLTRSNDTDDKADGQPKEKAKKKDRDAISRPVFTVVCHLLSPSTLSSGQVEALAPLASTFLIRVLTTLTARFKVEASVGGSAAVEFEAMLLSAAITLLDGFGALPTVELPAGNGTLVADSVTARQVTYGALAAYAHLLSYASLAAVSSASSVSKLLTRFFTSALRSRFDVPDAHRLLFLLLTLQLAPGSDRNAVASVLSLRPSALLAAPTTSHKALKVLDSAGVEMLSAHTVFDLIVSHSHFLPSLLPALSTSTPTAESSPAASASSVQLRHSILHLLYLLFNFPASPAPIPAPPSFLTVLTSAYTGTHSPLDVTLFALLSLLVSSSSSSTVLSSRTRWGEMGQQQLQLLIASGDSSSATVNRLDDDGTWLYTAFSAQNLQRGPLLSTATLHIPHSLTSLSVFSPHDSTKHHKQRSDQPAAAATSAVGGDVLSSHYSPHFVLPFFLHLFRHSQPDVRRLIELGVLAYALMSLSHPLLGVRKLGYKLIGKFYSEMERTQAEEDKIQAERTAQRQQQQQQEGNQPPTPTTTTPSDYHDPKRQRTLAHVTFKEQPELLFLLTTLRNSITTPHMHLSCILTSFLAASSVILLHPTHSMYRPTNRFLTLSPTLPLRSVPLFHDLLLSRRPTEWRHDRAHLLHYLHTATAGGGPKEWSVLRRRGVLSSLLTFHDSRHADRYTRTLVLECVKRVAVMGRAGAEEAVQGEEAEWAAAGGEGGVALAGLVRNHGLLVWVRQMVAGQGLGLATLVPAMELALLVVREVQRRLPDEAPRMEEQVEETTVKEVAQVDMESSDDSSSEDEAMSDVDDTALASSTSKLQTAKADSVISDDEDAEHDEEDEAEQADGKAKEDTAAGRLKAARALSRRRIGLAQDMQLLASSLAQRLTQTLQQQTAAKSQPGAAVSGEATDSDKKADDVTETTQLGFGSSSTASLNASLPTISLCLSLLHGLAVTARKARKASGIDQSTSSFSALLSSAGCLEVSLTPSQAALLCASATQLSSSSRADIFHSITLSALALPLVLAGGLDGERAAAVSVAQWTHEFVLVEARGGGSGSLALVAQWLSWLTALLSGQPLVRDWLLASEQLVVRALLSVYPLLMLPATAPASSSGLAQLNRSLLHFDSLLPTAQQLSHRLQSNHHHSTLRAAYGQLRAGYDKQAGVSEWGSEVKAAVLLHDVWLVVLAGDVEAQADVVLHSVMLQQREKGKQNGNGSARVNGVHSRLK